MAGNDERISKRIESFNFRFISDIHFTANDPTIIIGLARSFCASSTNRKGFTAFFQYLGRKEGGGQEKEGGREGERREKEKEDEERGRSN